MAWGNPHSGDTRLSFAGGEECPTCRKNKICSHEDRKTSCCDKGVAICLGEKCNAAFCTKCGKPVVAVPGESKKFTCTT